MHPLLAAIGAGRFLLWSGQSLRLAEVPAARLDLLDLSAGARVAMMYWSAAGVVGQ